MTEDSADEAGVYDPTDPAPPARRPPERRTAPQSPYTGGQVLFGFVVLLIGLAVTVALPLLLA